MIFITIHSLSSIDFRKFAYDALDNFKQNGTLKFFLIPRVNLFKEKTIRLSFITSISNVNFEKT